MQRYCPNCEKVRPELKVEKKTGLYQETEINCSGCGAMLLYTKRLVEKKLDK